MSDSLITKKAIAAALKQLCREKTFEKISIADITAKCGLNRQTFYYHFQDKYELLNWIYYNENFALITQDITLENWNQKILEMLLIMEREKAFYVNSIKEQEHTFEGYLFEMTKTLFLEAFDHIDLDDTVGADERDFDAQFYAYGFCGVIVSWAEGGMKLKPLAVAARLKSLAENTERIGYIRTQESL